MEKLFSIFIASILTISISASVSLANSKSNLERPKMLGKNNSFIISDLPLNHFRKKLESLPSVTRKYTMDWLHKFDFPENDLDVMVIDEEGGVLYVDPTPLVFPTEESTLSFSVTEDTFWLHSHPGASNVVYLDFDGHSFSGTAWSSGTIQAKPFDLDGSPSTFNETERNAIAEIWHRVAEDFAAFDIDVTTEEPQSFGPRTGRVLITSKTDANGGTMPYGSAGGVAYINVWGRSDYASYYSPALVYYDNLVNSTTYIAEASAHEFGHNLGLSHDGTNNVIYYTGHGSGDISWAPIMGNSYYNNVTQWSKGEYNGANNTQDDLSIIASKLYLLEDDHGDTLNTASPLLVETNGQILVSNPETDPHNIYVENKGIIEKSDDQDMFYFSANAGQIDFNIVPAWDAFYRSNKRGANLDIQAKLLNTNGTILEISDPNLKTDINLSTTVSAGTYYLSISGTGNNNYSDYASIGQYFIYGLIVPNEDRIIPPIANFTFECTNLNCNFNDNSSDNDGFITSWLWDFGDGVISTIKNPNHIYTLADIYTVSLTVTDNDGIQSTTIQNITVTELIDKEAPIITITNPKDGDIVNHKITLAAFASDNEEVVQIYIYANDVLLCSGISNASCIWNLRKISNGEYIIKVEAIDLANNYASKTITIFVLNEPKGNSGKKK